MKKISKTFALFPTPKSDILQEKTFALANKKNGCILPVSSSDDSQRGELWLGFFLPGTRGLGMWKELVLLSPHWNFNFDLEESGIKKEINETRIFKIVIDITNKILTFYSE